MEAVGIFTKKLWKTILPIYNQIISSGFVKQLATGTLEKEYFAHYLSQDVLYVKEDAVAFGNIKNKAPNEDEKQFFHLLQQDGLEMEKVLQQEYLDYFQIDVAKKKSATIQAYTDFLLFHSTKSPYSIGISALLPCFWVYSQVGKAIAKNSNPDNSYQKWIATYMGDAYAEYTRKFIEIVEQNAKNATEDTKQKMQEVFVQATQYELSFFEESRPLVSY